MGEENRFLEHYTNFNDHVKNIKRNNMDDMYRSDAGGVYRFILGAPVMDIGTVAAPGMAQKEMVMYQIEGEDGNQDVDVCSDMYMQNSELSIIKLSKRKSAARQGEYRCKVCYKTFTQLVNLATHERIHTGERPYRCDVCLKTFTQQPNLWKHIRTHTGERPYKCEICSKSFTQQANLNKHIRTHTGERPYVCTACGKSFSQQVNLTKHIRLHTGERPFHCRFCSKTFVQQSNLDRHEQIHTGIRPYNCKMCWKSFGQKGNLLKHQANHHGNFQDQKQHIVVKEDLMATTVCDPDTKNYDVFQEYHLITDLEKINPIPVLLCTKTGKILKRLE